MKNQENPPFQLLTALLFCGFALTGMLVNLLWPVIFIMAIIVGFFETTLFGFPVYSLLMLSLGLYLLTHATRPGLCALEAWTDKKLKDYEDR
jgi:hypothetical protein